MKYEYLHTHRVPGGEFCDAVLVLDVDRYGMNPLLTSQVCPGCGVVFTADQERAVEERAEREIADRMDDKKEYDREMQGSAYGIEEWL